MKKIHKMIGLVLAFVILLTAIPVTTEAASPVGNIPMNPIQLSQNQKKSTSFSKDYNCKYFSIVLKNAGILKISYSSEKMKKPVEMKLNYIDGFNIADTKTVKFDKKKKKASGTLTSTYILQPGTYTFTVSTEDVVSAKTAFTIKTSLTTKKFDDKEPNNTMAEAQKITVGSKASSYKMYLSGTEYAQDMMDYFTFKVKKGQKVTLKVDTKSSADLRIVLKRKLEKDEEIINADSAKQHLKKDGSKYTLSYTSDKLEAGEYYVMVWLQNGEKEQTEYNISFAAK